MDAVLMPAAPVLPLAARRLEHPVRGNESLRAHLWGAAQAGGRIEVIAAPGGRGKTTLALELAARARDRTVWHMHAGDADSLDGHMRALATLLSSAERARQTWEIGGGKDLVWDLLSRHEKPWLLILDNADDPEVLSGVAGEAPALGTGWYRRPPGHGVVVVTSRIGDKRVWGSSATVHDVADLSVEDAVTVLTDRAERDATPGLRVLAERLALLPLALDLAGSQLRRDPDASSWDGPAEGDPVGELLAVLGEGGDEDVITRIYTPLIERSLRILARHHGTAVTDLLHLVAAFADAPVPYTALLRPQLLVEAGLFAELTGKRLDALLGGLHRHGLITRVIGEGRGVGDQLVSMHPLVRETCRTHPPDHRATAAACLRMATDQYRSPRVLDASASHTWGAWRLLPAHLAVLGASAGEDVRESLAFAAGNILQYYYEAGQYGTSSEVLDLADTFTAGLPADHPATLAVENRRIRVDRKYGDQNTRKRALDLLARQELVYGGDHPEALICRNEIASAAEDSGSYLDALRLYRRLLADCERVHGPDHPDTLAIRNNIATSTAKSGQFAEALRLHRTILTDRERVLGPDHPDTLSTRSNIAASISDLKDHAEALRLHTTIYADRLRVLGPDHPETLSTRNNIATCTSLNGDPVTGLARHREVFADRSRALGPDHPDTMGSRYNIATLFGELGRHDEALALFEELIADQTRVLGPMHTDTLDSRGNHVALTSLRNPVRARVLIMALLRDARRGLGPKHPTVREIEKFRSAISSVRRRRKR
ncbi:hypothetical protein Afil01_25650 [Actinorhabdospora filicis]|uniref:Tetratricopeptide repeat protein n=1 Tax=Actinorhabdospora filicis TaxID=1785913 RepID=A0A9W6SKP3_9ACTN|nr:tetratricopeptide repeat protein [Actinorhabdospora filicis]GLZ77758.1 hypothetical protein Afil01_25650 [Actinorhabdospora filicis]